MKLSAVLLAVVAAQDGDDRWSFYDYSIPNDGRVGHAVSGVGMATMGGHEGNRRYCHSTMDTLKIHRWDASMNGYFAHFNPVECIGEELFCSIEERAHFGQVIGIRAGCAQMMNHPQVPTALSTAVLTELKNHYNQEAARGASFNQGGTAIEIFYGIGGCLALPAQNGYDTSSLSFSSSMKENYFMGTSGGYGQNQCLRQQRLVGMAQLLPFGVSVCRTCCVASGSYYDSSDGPCNFWPYGVTGGNGALPTIQASDFDCAMADTTACAFDTQAGTASTCQICHREMYPNFSMYMQPDYSTSMNVFEHSESGLPFCNSSSGSPACYPAFVYGGSQQIVG